MPPRSFLLLSSLLACTTARVAADILPYNPTRLLLASQGQKSTAFVFQPSTTSSGQSQFLSLDLTSPLNASNLHYSTLFDSLPFLQDGSSNAYTPVIDIHGNIIVSTGNCTGEGESTQIWRYIPDSNSVVGNGTWTACKVTAQNLGVGTGSNYLAAGAIFSEYVNGSSAEASMYVFGGMCPFANTTAPTWTSDAGYSDLVLSFAPQGTSTGYIDYQISTTSSTGPPISEAGFSVTALPPTYSVNSSEVAQSQQQDFVLLGGHTRSAFINMSQVALFSLPQESWTFLPVTQPEAAKTDLTTRQSGVEVDPRSGHTALLSDDGSTITLFGGWVGDVDTPATPQLAVLQLGSGYGGDGDWTWSVPSQVGSNGLGPGAGIYGHGAAMLPGSVMMVVGGYAIPATMSKRTKRAGQTANSQVYFYNTTSNAWIPSYSPPPSVESALQQYKSKQLGSSSEKAGLGVGLGLGFAILAGLCVFYFWYTRRLRRARRELERELLAHSSHESVSHFDQPFLEMRGVDGRGGEMTAVGYWDDREHGSSLWAPATNPGWRSNQTEAREAERTGLFVNIPSPTRGLRKGPSAQRNYQYHAAPRYDEHRLSRGSGNIHSIAETAEEYERSMHEEFEDDVTLSEAQRQLRAVGKILTPRPASDPFRDPDPNPLGSHPVSPETLDRTDTVRSVPTGASRALSPPRPLPHSQQGSLPNWVADYGPAASSSGSSNHTGRISPSKSDERTSSTLSERSQRSNISAGSLARTISTRTGALLAPAVATGTPADDNRSYVASTSGRKSPFFFHTRTRSLNNGSALHEGASGDADSFTTSRSNFAQLRNEGGVLLGGRAGIDRDDPYQRAMAAHAQTRVNTASSTLFNGDIIPLAPPRRRMGWMGSLRRALAAVPGYERSASMTSNTDDFHRSSSSSPTKDRPDGSTPRRAASDGGALLRQKRGKRDWDSDMNHFPAYRDNDWGEPRSSLDKREQEADWDVEDAAAKRDVQIMFTVPKSRLRIVNADADRASMRSASEGALSRTESLKQLRREESTKTVRVSSDGDKKFLQKTLGEKDETDDAHQASAAKEKGA